MSVDVLRMRMDGVLESSFRLPHDGLLMAVTVVHLVGLGQQHGAEVVERASVIWPQSVTSHKKNEKRNKRQKRKQTEHKY